MLEFKNVTYKIDNKNILNDVSFNVQKKDFISIIGPNGAGKTTILELIMKMINKTEGQIVLNGKEIENYTRKELAKKISYVPQVLNTDSEFSVKDVILMGRIPYIKILEDYNLNDCEIANNAMRRTNIFDLKDRNIETLSGGELQRVFIARALAQETEIMVLDEPISNLDIYQQLEIMNLLKTLNNDGISIIAVLHDMSMALKYSNKAILLNEGQVYESGLTENVIKKENIFKVFKVNTQIENKNIFVI